MSMGTLLNLGGFSRNFRHKILRPMFVNFLMAANVFDMSAALFARYFDSFDIETATPMWSWDQGTRRTTRTSPPTSRTGSISAGPSRRPSGRRPAS